MKKLSTDKAPAAIGPYSQAVITGNLLFSSGQIALDPETGVVVGETIEEQTEQVMKNLGAILEEAGLGYGDVVKTVCFLDDMGYFAALSRNMSGTITNCLLWRVQSPPSIDDIGADTHDVLDS